MAIFATNVIVEVSKSENRVREEEEAEKRKERERERERDRLENRFRDVKLPPSPLSKYIKARQNCNNTIMT